MTDFIDIYCERMAQGFWNEPVNALTNLSFFIAAFFSWRLISSLRGLEKAEAIQTFEKEKLDCLVARAPRNDGPAYVLIFLQLAIGTGSFLFHTLATGWAQLADVLPILLYQIAFLLFYARHVMGLRRAYCLILLAGFFAAIYGFALLPERLLNGSLSYGPALLFLSGLALWHWRNAAKERWALPAAAGVFLLSLTLRSLDMAACAAFPLGTHFLWHVLNGVVLYLTARAYILNGKS